MWTTLRGNKNKTKQNETKTKLIGTETTPNPKYNHKPKTQQKVTRLNNKRSPKSRNKNDKQEKNKQNIHTQTNHATQYKKI